MLAKSKNTLNKMEDPVEQITATDEATPASRPTKKDPKKVAAGKALARKNKEAREAKLKLDGRQQVEGQSQPSSLFDTFRNASILVGSALVLYHGYQAFNTAFPSGRVKSQEATPPERRDVPGLSRPADASRAKEENSIQME